MLATRANFATWAPRDARQARSTANTSLAFGPQHPAAHGILRMMLQLQGEVVNYLDPAFGYLHRGSEKLVETRTYLQALPYYDRFDYVANLFHEHAFCLAVEALPAAETYAGAALLAVRTLFDELSRYLNHLLTLSATALDLGVMGPIFWAFEEREYAFELLERVSGARMHTSLHRPYTFDFTALTPQLFFEFSRLLTRCARALSGAFLGLLNNRSFKTRLSLIGQLSPTKVTDYGVTGVVARSSGLALDLRQQPLRGYGAYASLGVRTFLGRRGDNLDRFVIRVKEVAESFRLMAQLLAQLSPHLPTSAVPLSSSLPLSAPTPPWIRHPRSSEGLAGAASWRSTIPPVARLISEVSALTLAGAPSRGKHVSMEAVIAHFKAASEGQASAPGLAYRGVESPKGEVAVLLVSDGGARPSRMKLRTAVSHNMHLIPSTSVGTLMSDFVATFCAYDIVLGEIDR